MTEDDRIEGLRLLAEAEAAFELGETPDRVRTEKDFQAWLFFNAKELLSPAPIDWKRVEEIRTEHNKAVDPLRSYSIGQYERLYNALGELLVMIGEKK